MARKASALFSVFGIEINAWVAIVVSAIGLVAFYRLRRRAAPGPNRPDPPLGGRIPATTAPTKSSLSIVERLAVGNHKQGWSIVITTDVLFATGEPAPLGASRPSDVDVLRRLVK